jgi:hypothetical protein
MPKLPDDVTGAPDNDQEREFKPVPSGRYVMVLDEVLEDVTGPDSKSPGTDKFVYKLRVDLDYHPLLRDKKKGPFSTYVQEHVPCTAAMKWKHKQIMEAFGYTVDSDTNEIIEDPEARAVAYLAPKPDFKDPEKKRTTASRYVAFDPKKFVYSPEVAEDNDDNQ